LKPHNAPTHLQLAAWLFGRLMLGKYDLRLDFGVNRYGILPELRVMARLMDDSRDM
jgi:hypothetical protein